MKKILLVLLFVSGLGFAQINYEPGYFITNDGTKTDCLIQNRAWKSNPTKFQYLFSKEEKPQTESIENVAEFTINDIYKYKRFTAQIDQSPTYLNNLSTQKDPVWSTKTIFLKVLIQGKINLYQYEIDDHTRYFISVGNHEQVEQLVYKEYLRDSYVAKNYYFRQQLMNLMKSEKLPESHFINLNYTKKPLTELILKYNQGNENVVTDFSKKQNTSKISLKASVGFGLATLKSANQFRFSNYQGSSPNYRIGFEVEGTLPFNNNKWAFFADPNLNFFSDSGQTKNYKVETKYNYLQFPFGLRHYLFLNNSSKVFINAGFAFNLPTNSTITQTLLANKTQTVVELEKSTSFFAGVGYSRNKVSAELRYNFANSLTNISTYTIEYSLASFVVGYKF